jgi:hypothetical protein
MGGSIDVLFGSKNFGTVGKEQENNVKSMVYICFEDVTVVDPEEEPQTPATTKK